MESFNDPLYSKVHALAVGLLEGTLAPEGRLELEKLILENQAARQAYLEYVQESACLRWLCVEEFPNVVELASRSRERSDSGKRSKRIAGIVFGGGLACVLVALTAAWWVSGNTTAAKVGRPEAAAVEA